MKTFRILLPLAFVSLVLLSGCGTGALDAESTREVVLQYLGADTAVGTAGPFHKGGKAELGVLSPTDRKQAEGLLDRGAAMFLVYAPVAAQANADASGNAEPRVARVIFVQGGKVAGDFRATPAS